MRYKALETVIFWGRMILEEIHLPEPVRRQRHPLTIGFAAMLVSVVFGTLLGTVSGYMGGKVDSILMRIVDIFLSIPNLLLFIIVIYAFVQPSLVTPLVLMLAFFVDKRGESGPSGNPK